MGYTLNCMVLGKRDYYSEMKKKQQFQLDVYDGNDKVTILDVPQDVYDSVTQGEILKIECKVRAYAREGRPAELLIGFIKLV